MSQPTNVGHGFCGDCGVPLPGPVKFCPSCGHVLVAASQPAPSAPPPAWQPPPPPAYAPPATPPSYEQLDWSQPQPQQQPRPRSRRALLLVGGLALLLVVGGSVAAVLLLGGNDSRLLGGGALVGAVTEEPEEQWSWSPSGTVFGGAAVGDVLVVGSDGDEGVTALDEDGEELWTSEVGGYPYTYAGQDDVVFVSPLEGEGTVVLSIETGEELWSFDGYLSRATEEGLVSTSYADDQTLALLDAKTGDELWSIPSGESFTVTDDAAYVLDGSELTRFALDSGEEEWSIGTDFRADDESYVWLAATDDMVVLSDGDVAAFDAGSGDELWTEDGLEGTEVGAFSATRVYLLQSDYTDDEMLTEVSVYDRDGRVGDLDLDPEDYFSGLPFESGGDEYNLDFSAGRLYDEELEEIGQYDGTLALVDGGLYTHEEDGELSYYELGSGSPAWSVDGPVSDSEEYGASLVPFDDRLVVVTSDEVVSYK